MGIFINLHKLPGVCALTAGLLISCSVAAQQPEQEPLAVLQLDTDGNGTEETVELYGGQMVRSSSYQGDLLLLVKNGTGDLLTAYVPSVKGGYAAALAKGSFAGKGEQVILSVGQGNDGESTEYRIIDFADLKAVKEIFTGSDNLGVAASTEYLPDFRSKIVFADGTSSEDKLPGSRYFYEQRGLYAADGALLKSYRRPKIDKITSLVAVDTDQDGTVELLSLQNVRGLNQEDLLGKLTGVWSYTKDSGWQLKTQTFYSGGTNKEDKFHRSYNAKNWRVFSKQAVLNGNSVTYPMFSTLQDADMQNKINRDFSILAAPYLRQLSTGSCELDYTLTFVGDKFISLVFFGVMDEAGKEIFAKIPLNIDVKTGEQLVIGDVLNLQDADLLPVLKVLTKKDQVNFSNGVPANWYYNGTNFVFCQRSEQGEWLETVAAAVDLKKFLLRPELFQKS